MAWRCSGSSNAALVNNLVANGLISNERVKKAMLAVRTSPPLSLLPLDCPFPNTRPDGSPPPSIEASIQASSREAIRSPNPLLSQVDRAHYAPFSPYEDSPQPLGHGATISAPHMHAAAVEGLLPFLKPGAHVLDVGSGSGYLTRVLAELVQPGGTVIGVDHIDDLVQTAEGNVARTREGTRMVHDNVVRFVKADGRKGYPRAAPYDAIHVGAAALEHHQALVDQLKAPGR